MSGPASKAPGLAPALLDAYRAARYRVGDGRQSFELRIDAPSDALAACHRAHGVDRSAFLTAWNPGSRPAAAPVNAAAQSRLEDRLRALGFALLPGQGIDPTGAWPAEDSVLALGIGREEASAIARAFGQAALVHAAHDAVPRLVLVG
jgi:hypothetical protein